MVESPFVENLEAVLVKRIGTDKIVEEYQKRLKMDVSRFFTKVKEIQVYQCPKTGYAFFYPYQDVAGDGKFYQELQSFPWYYMPWKWEHDYVRKNVISKTDKLLEVGCGHASFLIQLAKEGFDVTGLELNPDSVAVAAKGGVTVHLKAVQDFAEESPVQYDVVCSFQVLEHIQDVKSFIAASLKLLKPGGTFIISVPNNESFIKHHTFDIMNMPPHHMGLWDQNSLTSLTEIFPIKLSSIAFEPLQDHHFKYYNQIMVTSGEYSKFNKVLSSVLYPITQFGIKRMAGSIPGHTVVAVYKKEAKSSPVILPNSSISFR